MRNIVIDARMREVEKEYIKSLGFNLIELEQNSNLYYEISSHVDIFFSQINNTVIVEPTVYKYLFSKINKYNDLKNRFISGISNVANEYPNDIKYNICQIGKNIIHNYKYTDGKVLEEIEKNNLKKIEIKQGYANCSIAVIDNNSCIVTDKKIAVELKKYDIDVLLINEELDINLYSENKIISRMKGFIGGCLTRIDNKIICFGDIDKIDNNKLIRRFIKSKNLELVDFKNLDVIDYGGTLVL